MMQHSLRPLCYRLALALLRRVTPGRRRRYRLVILKLDRLGDAVLSLGAVRLLLAEFGTADSLLIVSTIAAPLFRREFPTVELLVMPPFSERFWPDFVKTMLRHAAQLRAIDTDHLVCLRHQASDYLHAIAALVHARHVYASEWPAPLEHICLSYPRCHRAPYPVPPQDGCLELEAHRRVIQTVINHPVVFHDIIPTLVAADTAAPPATNAAPSAATEAPPATDTAPATTTTSVPLAPAFSFVAAPAPVAAAAPSAATDAPAPTTDTTPTLLVCPLTGNPIRQYPPESLAQAIALFVSSTPGLRVTFCLPPGADRTPWQQALHAVGIPVTWQHPENLNTLLQAISAARLILAPDSAPAHLATAMDRPGVFLLGGGQYGMFAPWQRSPLQIWLSHPLDCYHCQWHCIHPEPLCITHISPQTIATALRQAHNASVQ